MIYSAQGGKAFRWLAGPALALLALGACTRQAAAPAAPAGVVRFSIAADPTTLDPLFIHPDAASVEAQLARLSFEPFVEFDRGGHAFPELLRVIPSRANGGISADGRTIVYHLRAGVRWSDGVPVSSADVLFTLHAILNPANPVRSRAGYDLIASASAPNPSTVILRLRRPWAPAVTTYFSDAAEPQYVLPAHVLQREEPLARAPFNAMPNVVDGPFRLVRWRRGESLRYVANPRYWRGAPRAAALDVRVVADPSTNLILLQSGALDWNLIAPTQVAAIRHSRARRDVRFIREPTAVVAGIAFNTHHPPLDDVRIRRAIAMSIDRTAISKKITLGAYPPTAMMQPSFSWAYDPKIAQPRYDPQAADALFDAAGWRRGPSGMRRKNGRALRLVYVQFPESTTGVRVATAVQAALRARGVDLVVKSVSNAQLFLPVTGTLASGAFDMAYVPWTLGGDPDDSFVLTCGAPSNVMGWCDRRVDALERAALRRSNRAARTRLYAAIARRVASQVPILYLFEARYIYAYRTRLHGFAPNPFLPTWNAYAWSVGDR